MKILSLPIFIYLLLVCGSCVLANEEEGGVLDCIFDNNTASCLSERLARDLDRIELEVSGERKDPPISKVVEEAGNLVAEVMSGVQDDGDTKEVEEQAESRGIEEARKKKFGKKKKKHLQKLLALAMLFKAKLSLLLQLLSTHLQLKFFVIALVSLLLNAARFWLDLKKVHQPSKVIYYEHAQHHHRYDHEDDYGGGYWGRSSNVSPQEIAYNAHVPEQ